MTEKQLNKEFETIAKEILNIDTLETRRSDSLDFPEVAVWSIKEALKRAYELGLKEGKKKDQPK